MMLIERFKRRIMSPNAVIETAIARKLVPPFDNPANIKQEFSMLAESLQIDAYNIYLEAEAAAGKEAIREELLERTASDATRGDTINAACSMFNELDRFYLSLTQSRRTRAGKTFEIILKTLFKRLGYPFSEQQVINGKPDFLMPSREHYNHNPMDCIIFTAKRTLRERWRQIVTEGTRGLGFYLATIDEKISENQLVEMRDHRIYLVVPRSLKQTQRTYHDAPNVLTFEDFFRHHLDPAVIRWRDNNVI